MATLLNIGFSPCPNDTFIFDALVNDAEFLSDIQFNTHLEDVQTLNQWALVGKLDVTKISYGVLPFIQDHYQLLPAGGALGKGVGPLLVSQKNHNLTQIEQLTVALPGKNTTAHFLFQQAFPNCHQKTFLPFHQIEEEVVSGRVDIGVIIHENRFTYAQKGLIQLADLGKVWEDKTGYPIPLGGIVVKKELPTSIKVAINNGIQASLQLSRDTYPTLSPFVKCHAQEMSEAVMRQHIDLYVNDFSHHIQPDGIAAILQLFQSFAIIPQQDWLFQAGFNAAE